MTYHIALCDDEPVHRQYLAAAVNAWAHAAGHELQTETFASAEAFLFRYAEDKSFDILLLDIEMEGMDGIRLAKKIRQENEQIQILFITGYEEYLAEGYEVGAIHYLLKPLNEEKFNEVMDRAVSRLRKTERSLLFTVDGESFRIPVADILFAEAFGHTVSVITRQGSFELRDSLSRTSQRLGNGFIHCHRSCIVNLRAIVRVTRENAVLDDGTCIPLSRRMYQDVNRAFISYYRRQGYENF